MIVKIKKLDENAVIPSYAMFGDAGLDLTATDVYYEPVEDVLVYKTGLSIEIPKGYVGLIFPRSSISKKDLILTNSVGVIDSGYRGEIIAKFKCNHDYFDSTIDSDLNENGIFKIYNTELDQYKNEYCEALVYKVGDRIAQLIILPYPQIELQEVEQLNMSQRGEGCYGSTGN